MAMRSSYLALKADTVTVTNYNTEEGRNTSYCQLMYKSIKQFQKQAVSDCRECKGGKAFMDLKKFVLEGNPVCRKEAVIVGDHFRITMLTTALIRFEYSEDGGFEDMYSFSE